MQFNEQAYLQITTVKKILILKRQGSTNDKMSISGGYLFGRARKETMGKWALVDRQCY